jgi:hypothetical protein
MVNSVELIGALWGALSGVCVGFVVLRGWRAWRGASGSPAASPSPALAPLLQGDSRLMTFESRELDLGREVSGALAQLQDAPQRYHVEVQISVPPDLAIWADPDVLRQMLAGILMQAMERAKGAAVLLSAEWHAGRVQVTVVDDGPTADRAALTARLRGVEQYAALQGGMLEIECRSARGNRVVLRMPGSSAPDHALADDDASEEPTVVRSPSWTGALSAP